MDSSDSSSINRKKTIKIASLYGLVDPFFDPQEASRKIKHIEQQANKKTADADLQFLYILASVLNLDTSFQSIRNTYIHVNEQKKSLKKAIALHVLSEKGTISISDATRKVHYLNDELKAQGVEKPLRKLTIIATILDKDNEPYLISKKLKSIQTLFNPSRQKD